VLRPPVTAAVTGSTTELWYMCILDGEGRCAVVGGWGGRRCEL